MNFPFFHLFVLQLSPIEMSMVLLHISSLCMLFLTKLFLRKKKVKLSCVLFFFFTLNIKVVLVSLFAQVQKPNLLPQLSLLQTQNSETCYFSFLPCCWLAEDFQGLRCEDS